LWQYQRHPSLGYEALWEPGARWSWRGRTACRRRSHQATRCPDVHWCPISGWRSTTRVTAPLGRPGGRQAWLWRGGRRGRRLASGHFTGGGARGRGPALPRPRAPPALLRGDQP
jgi:hypothetical protein